MPLPRTSLAWGQKLTPNQRGLVFELCERQLLVPDYLMSCMAFESAETFRPNIRNAAGSGAVGLIQFMPATVKPWGITTEQLAALTVDQQLAWVERYFKPYRGRLHTLADHYMAILWPKGIGKPESWALWSKAGSPITFRQNAGLDVDRNGVITKAEAAKKVQAKLVRGMLPQFRWQK